MQIKPLKKDALTCQVSTKFTRDTFARLQKLSKESRLYFDGLCPVAEIVRVAVEEKIQAVEMQAQQKVRMP